MNHGRIEQVGAPDGVYTHPANAFVYGFLGTVNRFHGRTEGGVFTGDGLKVDMPVVAGASTGGQGAATAYARPHDLDVERYTPGSEGVVADLVRQYLRGPNVLLELERSGTESTEPIEVELPRKHYERLGLRLGETLVVRPRALRVFTSPAEASS